MNKLYLIRGHPGSGKSTLARSLTKAGFIHYEADMYFLLDHVVYYFDASKVKEAHGWCQMVTKRTLENGADVVVSNTFTQLWELEPYLKMAANLGIQPNIIECCGKWENIHNVPDTVIENMKARWETLK